MISYLAYTSKDHYKSNQVKSSLTYLLLYLDAKSFYHLLNG